jgi:NADPH oxidase
MGFMEEVKKNLWGSRLLFNILFHGGHIGLFVYGWLECRNKYPVLRRRMLTICAGRSSKTIQGWLALTH